ncbi:hypothetical protein [Arthrobacter rhombi]|uniref:hypothetical protein n=1 Tax=Arthrobacter rhombi TaxID=71253 RepID=UPI003F8FFEA9
MLSAEILEAATAWTSPRIVEWSPPLQRNLSEWLEPSMALVGDAAWGARIRDLVQLPIDDPLEWANRRITLPGGDWAIAGIRFRDRDISKPFVDIIATSLAPEPSQLAVLTDVLPHFAGFSPLCLRIHCPDPEQTRSELARSGAYGGHATTDLLVVAGLLETLKRRAMPSTSESVDLRPGDPEAVADRVAAMYDELEHSRPGIRSWARPADVDVLSSAAEENLLFEVCFDSEPIGVVAAAREDAYGMSGYSVQELCIDAEHRGRQLGSAVLLQLCGRLPITSVGDVLWGHIHPENKPSLRNSISMGRQVVGGHLWLTPAGYPGMPA